MSASTNEEASKKNTDCVYFLASPLTCKKGNDCEFRHSESARINPRDCRYWLSGSCRNAHCPFRHPPLEGISEGDSAALAASIVSRPRVPCYYFSQGYCAKGDKCIFMHNMILMDQKIQKPSSIRAIDNQMSTTKMNASVTSKPDFADGEVIGSGENESQTKVIVTASRIYEGSDSSVSAKPQTHSGDGQRKVSSMNSCGLSEVKPVDSNFLHLKEIQAEDDILCEARQTNESMQQMHTGDDRIQNATDSEELWEESSFDVLVDDGNDQLIYTEDMDFISSCDVIVDPLRAHIQAGLMSVEGYADYDYEQAGAYDQYYEATEYELATYEAYEQQMSYDQLNPYDYNNGIHQAIGVKDIQAKRNRGMPLDAKEIEINSDDLRNHIVKRRRAERSYKSEGKLQKRQQQGNEMRHGQRHLDGNKKQYNGLVRNRSLQEAGFRSTQHLKGWTEPCRNSRQIHGRLGEPMSRRPLCSTGEHHEEVSAECGSDMTADPSNNKTKQGNGASGPIRNRVNTFPNNRKPEKNDTVFFQGPKTLAQIKAEKIKASHNINNSLDSSNLNKSRFEAGEITTLSTAKDNNNNEVASKDSGDAKDSDFEGPKPLSVILKEKRKERVNNQGLQEKLHEKPFRGLQSSISVTSGFSKDLQSDEYLLKVAGLYCRNGTQPDVTKEDKHEGALWDSTNDDKADASDSVMEDMEFDVEDDEFAMKLCQFSS